MRSMKTSGGLTRRGITDSFLAKGIGGSPGASVICSSLETFAGATFSSGEQYVDFHTSRQNKDAQDRAKIYEWFNDNIPFPNMNSLLSLSTGIIGNATVNCYQHLEIGTKIIKSIVGRNFSNVTQSKKNVVLSLTSMSSSIKVFDETVAVDPLTIFQRTAIAKRATKMLHNSCNLSYLHFR